MIDVFAYDSGVKPGTAKDLETYKEKPVWIDIIDITKGEADLLRDAFDLHPLTTEDFVKSNVRVKIEEFPHYTFFVFYGMNRDDVREIDFVLGEKFLITNHRHKIPSFEELKNNAAKLESLFKKGNDFLLHHLLDRELDNLELGLEEFDDSIESLEKQVTRTPKRELLTAILDLKQQLNHIRKYILAQREKISRIAKTDVPFVSKKSLPYFRDVNDHMIRIAETLESQREGVASTFDAYTSSVSLKSNEVMKTLSIIATIALPLTVISSLYGTNFSILPGADNPKGFWTMIIAMALLAIGLLISFRKRGWF